MIENILKKYHNLRWYIKLLLYFPLSFIASAFFGDLGLYVVLILLVSLNLDVIRKFRNEEIFKKVSLLDKLKFEKFRSRHHQMASQITANQIEPRSLSLPASYDRLHAIGKGRKATRR